MNKILKKNISKEEAEEIQDNMLERHAYWVEIVEMDEDDVYMVVGNKEEKECYDENWYLWDDDEYGEEF
jgi:hypothetical protein